MNETMRGSMMDPERLGYLWKLASKATEGPWHADIFTPEPGFYHKRTNTEPTPEGSVDVILCDGVYGMMEGADAKFIVHARDMVPELIESYQELQKQNQGVREQLRITWTERDNARKARLQAAGEVTELSRAIDRVRALHKPETRYQSDPEDGWSTDDEEHVLEILDEMGSDGTTVDNLHSFMVCSHCKHLETWQVAHTEGSLQESLWPCATILALDP